MIDLIDRQEAIKAVMFGSLSSSTVYGRSEQGMAAQKDTLLAIRMLSSVDAVKVVRCKDCKHYEEINQPYPQLFCRKHSIDTLDDDYCSYGERKDARRILSWSDHNDRQNKLH